MNEFQQQSELRGRKLDILCYIEGVRIPVKNIAISAQVGIPTVVTISTLPPNTTVDIYPTSHVAIFYAYLDSNDMRDIRDKYFLLFHGEITGTRYMKSGISLEYQLLAIDSRSYLNRLPDRIWPILYDVRDDFFPEFANDAAFLGIDTDPEGVIEQYVNNILKYFQVGKNDYTLKTYMDKILGLLEIQAEGYNYYYNANQRYRLRASHEIREYGDAFKVLHGAMRKASMIHNMNLRLYETAGTTLDAMASNLVAMGYNYTSVLAPKYKPAANGGAYYEYILMRDMINHRAPKFNFILIDEGDNISITTAMPSVTATKYKYKTSQDSYPIDNTFYPPGAMSGEKFKMTQDEKIYGISREIQEMDWFYNSFLADDAKTYTGDPEAQTLKDKQQYEFLLKRTGRNSVSCTKKSFIPDYVLGMPAIVYDPVTNRCFRGNIWKIAYMLNMEGGSCMTSVDIVNSLRMQNFDEANTEGPGGCNPIGKAAFLEDEENFYKTLFYGDDGPPGGPLLSGGDISNPNNHIKDNYYKFIARDHCTLKQYMTMHTYLHPAQRDYIPYDLLYASWDDQVSGVDEVGQLISRGDEWADDRSNKESQVLMDFFENSEKALPKGLPYSGFPGFDFMFLLTRKDAANKLRQSSYGQILRVSTDPTQPTRPDGWVPSRNEPPVQENTSDPAETVAKAVELADYDPKTMSIPAGDEALYMQETRKIGKETKSLLQWRINHLTVNGTKWPKKGTADSNEVERLAAYRNAHK